MNDLRGGLIYLGLAGLIGYAWVTGTMANVVGYLTRSVGGTPAPGARLDPQRKIQLLPLRPTSQPARTPSYPGGPILLRA